MQPKNVYSWVVSGERLAASGDWEKSLLSGPMINYRGNRWFVIFDYLPQLINLHKTAAPKSKVLDEHERAEARIVLGFSF